MQSKRHSRTVTPSDIHPNPNVSVSRPTSVHSPSPKDEWKPSSVPGNTAPISTHKSSKSLGGSPTATLNVDPVSQPAAEPSTPTPAPALASDTPTPMPTTTQTSTQPAPFSEPIAGPSTPSPQTPSSGVAPLPRKTSSFRHIPRRPPSVASRSPLPSSPLRTFSKNEKSSSIIGTPGSRIVPLAEVSEPERGQAVNFPTPVSSPGPYVPHQRPLTFSTSQTPAQPSSQLAISKNLPPSPAITASASLSPTPSIIPIPSSSPQPLGSQDSSKLKPTPYRPGFQPKGVYRPHTDAFLVLRSKARDKGRVERTKLERRLEKIVALHFSENTASNGTPSVAARERKRTSSLFSIESLSGLRDLDPSELWKGVLTSQVVGSAKADIRGKFIPSTPSSTKEFIVYSSGGTAHNTLAT